MALTQEQQSKLLEAYRMGKASGQTKEQAAASIKDYLIKSGQYDSAKAAYESPVAAPSATPAPVAQPVSGGAPVSPTAAPRTTAPMEPKASAPTPVAPDAPAPKPTATPAPVAQAPAVSSQRQQEIQQNLMEGSIYGKQNFTDVNKFRSAYGYDQKPEGEKAILDQFWSKYSEKNAVQPQVPAPAVKPTGNEVVVAIWNGQETPEMKADPKYATTKAAADRARQFSAMSADELVGAIAGSKITEEQANLISRLDPAFSQKWEAAKAQYKLKIDTGVANETASSLANAALGADVGEDGVTTEKYEDPIIKAITAQIDALTKASAKTQAEKDAQALVNEKKAKIDELTQARDKIYEDLSGQYTGVPKSLLMAMAAEKAKPINEQISTLTREANLALGQYNAAVEERQLAGDTAKTVASLNLEVAKRYTDVQEARAKALTEKLKGEKLDTKIETIKGRKVLVNMQTGAQIKDLGPDLENSKWELKEIGGKQYFYDPTTKTLQPALAKGEYDWKASSELAKEYQGTQTAKDFMQIANQVMRMDQLLPEFRSGKIEPGVMDIAIIKTMEKMLDPTSVVREGEFDNYLRASGLAENAKSLYSRYVGGAKIPDKVRDSLILAISKQYDAAVDVVQPLQDSFMKNIDSVNADPMRVFGGFMVSNAKTKSAQSLMEDEQRPWMSEL